MYLTDIIILIISHRYTDTIIRDTIYVFFMFHWYTDTPIHWIPSSSLPGCSVHSYLMFVYHCYMYSLVYMHVLFLYSCHMTHLSYYMYYCCMYIPVFLLHDCFPLLILIFSLLNTWAVDMQCVELSATWIQATRAASRIQHLLFPVSRYLVLCYQPSSCPVIMLHVPCTVLVLTTLCIVKIIKITWEWGRLDGWLDLIGWIYWIHIITPTAGDGSAGYRLYIAPWAPVSRFLLPS